eukprot:15484042-Alexandrium_andersonii.AAC.1
MAGECHAVYVNSQGVNRDVLRGVADKLVLVIATGQVSRSLRTLKGILQRGVAPELFADHLMRRQAGDRQGSSAGFHSAVGGHVYLVPVLAVVHASTDDAVEVATVVA